MSLFQEIRIIVWHHGLADKWQMSNNFEKRSSGIPWRFSRQDSALSLLGLEFWASQGTMILSRTPTVPSHSPVQLCVQGHSGVWERGKAICFLKFIPETVYYPSWPKYFKQLSALISSLAKNSRRNHYEIPVLKDRFLNYLMCNVHPHVTGLTDVSVPQAPATFSRLESFILKC